MTNDQVVIAWEYTTARGEKRFGHGQPVNRKLANSWVSSAHQEHPYVKHSILTPAQLKEWKREKNFAT